MNSIDHRLFLMSVYLPEHPGHVDTVRRLDHLHLLLVFLVLKNSGRSEGHNGSGVLRGTVLLSSRPLSPQYQPSHALLNILSLASISDFYLILLLSSKYFR